MPPPKRLIRYKCKCRDCGADWNSQFRATPVKACRDCKKPNFSAAPFDHKLVPWTAAAENDE